MLKKSDKNVKVLQQQQKQTTNIQSNYLRTTIRKNKKKKPCTANHRHYD